MTSSGRPFAVLVPHVSEALSHLLRAVEISFTLRANGWRVIILGSRQAIHRSRYLGIDEEIRVVPWDWGHNRWKLDDPAEQGSGYQATAIHLHDQFGQLRPDLIIGIPGIASAQAAAKAGIPHISVLHGPWLLPVLDPRIRDLHPGFDQAWRVLARTLEGPASVQLDIQGRVLDLDRFRSYHDFFTQEVVAVAHDEISISPRRNLYICGFLRGDFGPRVNLDLITPPPESCACVTFGSAIVDDLTPILKTVSAKMRQVVFVKGASTALAVSSKVISLQKVSIDSLAGKVGVGISHSGIGTVAAFYRQGMRQLHIPGDLDQAINAAIACLRGHAVVAGMNSWTTRRGPGRRLPDLNPDEVAIALDRLYAQQASSGIVVPSRGAERILWLAEKLLRGHLN